MSRHRTASGPGLALYLAQIGAHPLLTREEEALVAEHSGRNAGARPDALVESSLLFVVQAAKEFRDLGVPFEDLVNEGNLGLLEAARRFDARRGTRFLTYARWWIRKAMLRALAEQARLVRLPEYQLRRAREVRDDERAPNRVPGTNPTQDEVGDRLKGRTRAQARRGSLYHSEVSLDAVADDARGTFADRLLDRETPTSEERMIREQSIRMVLEAMEDLSEQQRRILSRRFGLSGERALSLKAIGKMLGLSHERVRQIEAEALDRIRRVLDRDRGRRGRSVKRKGSRGSRSQAAHAGVRSE